ncbi:PD-(D/E)XK nuclease family protein [Sodalinema gerasimenkoae]|uniref:PD-(D/E)XK nuclease family protein n=1 Tax=Sodalinema gerasimenkoae TaxID=2862348 RepID=UPI00135B540F|nr:PD-(D/E)XK nuclease family protein [Sodalinema gerasimenkoae]
MSAKNFSTSQPSQGAIATEAGTAIADPEPIPRLSQTALNRLEKCPRWFQNSLIEHRESPLDPQQQQRLARGNQFHQLMQQRELGLPVETLLGEDDPLRQWMQDFLERAPSHITPNPFCGSIEHREAEHERRLVWQDILWLVRYDLLLLSPDQAQILDWKTYPRPRSPKQLRNTWQTRLYPFVLAETSSYPPDAISMTYWFVEGSPSQESESSSNSPEQPSQCWQFNYSQLDHQKTRQDLETLAQQFHHYWRAYQQGQDFPRRGPAGGACDLSNCFCQTLDSLGQPAACPPTALKEIPEVSL